MCALPLIVELFALRLRPVTPSMFETGLISTSATDHIRPPTLLLETLMPSAMMFAPEHEAFPVLRMTSGSDPAIEKSVPEPLNHVDE
jgi:hypothetical protein